ncbi:MFS transporter [Rhodococcus sp. JS3073]|uniref:MFS transporter n=1 Tax=Rhodococcus sp. JS3073 TaxID=3002901 RepID=UPI0022868393|nr:MFS transporter [Rhodococcus sp. JS3073]WAM18930.1 MFS transporter [Rhodococcus sp. JS3073]
MTDSRRPDVSADHRSARIAAAGSFGLQGFLLAAVLTQLPQYQDRFGFDDTAIVVAVVTVSLIAGAGSVLAEHLARRFSSRSALRFGLATITVAGGALGFSPNTAAFFVCLSVYGAGLGIVDAAANMQAVSIQHAYGRFILSSFHAVWSVGAIAGALFVAATSALGVGVATAQLVAALVVAVGLAVCGPRLLVRREPAGTAAPATGFVPVPVPIRALLALGTAMALFYAIDFGVGNWSALYVRNVLLADAGTAALALAAYQCSALVSRLSGDHWVAKYGEIAVVRAGSAVGVAGLTIVVLAPSPAVAIAGFLVVGLGVPVVAPLCFSAAGRLAPGGQVDDVVARINLFNYVGTLVGGAIVGGVAAATSLRIGFVVPLLFAVGLILLAPAFAPDRDRARQSEWAPDPD